MSFFNPLAFLILSALIPGYFLAILYSESPDLTVYVTLLLFDLELEADVLDDDLEPEELLVVVG